MLNHHPAQFLCSEQGHLQLGQDAQVLVQPDLECLLGRGFYYLLATCGSVCSVSCIGSFLESCFTNRTGLPLQLSSLFFLQCSKQHELQADYKDQLGLGNPQRDGFILMSRMTSTMYSVLSPSMHILLGVLDLQLNEMIGNQEKNGNLQVSFFLVQFQRDFSSK